MRLLPPFLSWEAQGGEKEGKENFRGLPSWACIKALSNPQSCCPSPKICRGLWCTPRLLFASWNPTSAQRMSWSFLATHQFCHFLNTDVFHIIPGSWKNACTCTLLEETANMFLEFLFHRSTKSNWLLLLRNSREHKMLASLHIRSRRWPQNQFHQGWALYNSGNKVKSLVATAKVHWFNSWQSWLPTSLKFG